jgi:tRNA U34 5-methylaminomethyl-2-thiouridine-forming methyltransferase MnmC
MQLQETKTGEYTLYIPNIDETYHSRDGAVSESKHVFLQNGVDRTTGNIKILEIGFGTGLNALLTVAHAQNSSRQVYYHTLEPYPITSDLVEHIGYTTLADDPALFGLLHSSPWETDIKLTDHFTLHKSVQKLENAALEDNRYDVIYFDAFAPKKQPELWSCQIFQKLYKCTKPGGVLTTYSAAGQLKRNLKSVGYHIENPRGANGKREMTVALKD